MKHATPLSRAAEAARARAGLSRQQQRELWDGPGGAERRDEWSERSREWNRRFRYDRATERIVPR